MANDDELTTAERGALDDWAVVAPPAGFADRVLTAQHRPAAPRIHRLPIVAVTLGAAAAVALVIAVTGHGDASEGTLAVTTRTTAELGKRATIVAEPAAALRWHVSSTGAAEIDQTAGDVFYRVERGGPFVIHTRAGDVRVTGTCLRVEVIMKPTNQLIVSGAIGAALATAVVVTVYEGHVIADSRGTHTDLVAGSRTTMSSDGAPVAAGAPIAIATATREELASLAIAREEQIAKLKSRVAELESKTGKRQSDETDDGRPWYDPSHDKLVEWAEQCHIRFDEPSVDRFMPVAHVEDLAQRGVQGGELDGYNSAFVDVQKQWQIVVRALYIEATGDAAGADSLSTEAMYHEIVQKSPPADRGLVLQHISRERAGLAPPSDPSKLSPLEQLMRAKASLGDQAEQALAKRIGASRAHEIRGDGWESRSDMSGCPKQ